VILVLSLWLQKKFSKAKKEAEAEALDTVPQEDYYSTVNRNYTTDKKGGETKYVDAVLNESPHSKEIELSQEYAEVSKIKYIQSNVAVDQAEDETQMYSIVNTSAKKGMKWKQKIVNDIESPVIQDVSEKWLVKMIGNYFKTRIMRMPWLMKI